MDVIKTEEEKKKTKMKLTWETWLGSEHIGLHGELGNHASAVLQQHSSLQGKQISTKQGLTFKQWEKKTL